MRQLLLVAVLVFACAAVYAQGTPDGETPANEGICDDLMYATPGLYGLCIAYCEAQDCEPDFSLDDPFENCNLSNEKILRNYDRKKTEFDPDMPCIQAPCPCWTEEEVSEHLILAPPYRCSWFGTYSFGAYIDSIDDGVRLITSLLDFEPTDRRCQFSRWATGGFTRRYQQVDDQQWLGCISSLQSTQEALGCGSGQ